LPLIGLGYYGSNIPQNALVATLDILEIIMAKTTIAWAALGIKSHDARTDAKNRGPVQLLIFFFNIWGIICVRRGLYS
jgi:hypothetical protein